MDRWGGKWRKKPLKSRFIFLTCRRKADFFFLLLLCNWLTRNCVTRKFLRTNVASLFSRSFDLFLIANGKNCWNERLRPFHRDLKSADSAWLAYHNQTKRNVCPSLCPIKRKKNDNFFYFIPRCCLAVDRTEAGLVYFRLFRWTEPNTYILSIPLLSYHGQMLPFSS